MTSVEAPAKINLFLEVLDRRPDGYHNVCLINQAVDLVDRISFDPAGGEGDRLTVAGPFSSSMPADPRDNTVFRALALLRERWPDVPALDIRIEKNIPVGAGLGGGSADAAALAMSVRELFLPRVRRESVLEILASVGSDTPFAAAGGTALVEGMGERVTPIEFPFESVHYLLLSPPIEVSTVWAYEALGKIADRPRRDPHNLCVCLREGNYKGVSGSVWNAFEAVAFAEYPELAELVATLEEAGCDAAWMTGSGSNLVGLCPDRAGAESAMERLEVNIDYPMRIIQPYPRSGG